MRTSSIKNWLGPGLTRVYRTAAVTTWLTWDALIHLDIEVNGLLPGCGVELIVCLLWQVEAIWR